MNRSKLYEWLLDNDCPFEWEVAEEDEYFSAKVVQILNDYSIINSIKKLIRLRSCNNMLEIKLQIQIDFS